MPIMSHYFMPKNMTFVDWQTNPHERDSTLIIVTFKNQTIGAYSTIRGDAHKLELTLTIMSVDCEGRYPFFY